MSLSLASFSLPLGPSLGVASVSGPVPVLSLSGGRGGLLWLPQLPPTSAGHSLQPASALTPFPTGPFPSCCEVRTSLCFVLYFILYVSSLFHVHILLFHPPDNPMRLVGQILISVLTEVRLGEHPDGMYPHPSALGSPSACPTRVQASKCSGLEFAQRCL